MGGLDMQYRGKLLILGVVLVLAGCSAQPKDTGVQENEVTGGGDEVVQEETGETAAGRVDMTELMTSLGTAIEGSEYSMTGPMATRIRRNVDEVMMSEEGQGFSVRTSSGDETVNEAVVAVEEQLTKMGFDKTEAKPKNSASLVLEYRKYTNGEVTCVYEKRAIGSTGQVDITIGCY
jgi:hypothetical protein